MKEIDLPDGTVAEFPDGMTDAEIGAVLARQFGSPRSLSAVAQRYRVPNGENQRPGWAEEVAGGAKHAWDRAAMGLKGLFTDLTPEDKALLEQGGAFVKETGPASTVGQIGADVAMSAAPVARAAALPRVLGMTSRLAPAAADVAANAGYAAVTSPEDRANAAMWGAGGPLRGGCCLRLLAALFVPPVPAQRLRSSSMPASTRPLVKCSLRRVEHLRRRSPVLRRALVQSRSLVLRSARHVSGRWSSSNVRPVRRHSHLGPAQSRRSQWTSWPMRSLLRMSPS